jgi:threonine/homoserine/homoserine lactone efflux protein
MGYFTLFFTALIIAFSGAMMPGPLLTAAINESYYRGFSAGPRIILGHSIIELILIITLIFGFGNILTIPIVKNLVSIIGGIFLLWMGIDILRSVIKKKISGVDINKKCVSKRLNLELIGVLTSISNPYWTLWWATIGLGYLTIALKKGFIGVLIFYLGHISADFIWYTIISLGVSSGKAIISDTIYQVILIVCAIFLLGLSCFFIYSGINPFLFILQMPAIFS